MTSHPVQTPIAFSRADGPPTGSFVHDPVPTSNVAPSARSISWTAPSRAPPHRKKNPVPPTNVAAKRDSRMLVGSSMGGVDTPVHADAEPSIIAPSQSGKPDSLSVLWCTPPKTNVSPARNEMADACIRVVNAGVGIIDHVSVAGS